MSMEISDPNPPLAEFAGRGLHPRGSNERSEWVSPIFLLFSSRIAHRFVNSVTNLLTQD